MARRKKELTRLDQMLDELIGENPQPEDIIGQDGLLKQLTQRLMERALAGELSYHLQTEPDDAGETLTKRNSRNGHSKKTVQSEQGRMELDIPRDRNGTFEPILVPKHQRRLAGLDEKIVSLYGRGLSTRDIQAQLLDLYGVEIAEGMITEVTNEVLDEVKAWQSRPLDELYPILYLDALYVNIKVGGRVSKRAVYVVLGINTEGDKELLGLWFGEAESEGAKFWLKVLTDLKNRGLQDILIACCDGLKGFPKQLSRFIPRPKCSYVSSI